MFQMSISFTGSILRSWAFSMLQHDQGQRPCAFNRRSCLLILSHLSAVNDMQGWHLSYQGLLESEKKAVGINSFFRDISITSIYGIFLQIKKMQLPLILLLIPTTLFLICTLIFFLSVVLSESLKEAKGNLLGTPRNNEN